MNDVFDSILIKAITNGQPSTKAEPKPRRSTRAERKREDTLDRLGTLWLEGKQLLGHPILRNAA